MGLDEFLGHDIEPTIFRDSAAYPTKIPNDNLSSSSVAKDDHPDNSKEPESFLVQDLIMLTDFVGIPELINMVTFRDHKTLYRQLQSQIALEPTYQITDNIATSAETKFVFEQHKPSLCFSLCVMNLFGVTKCNFDKQEVNSAPGNGFCKVKFSGDISHAQLSLIVQTCEHYFSG